MCFSGDGDCRGSMEGLSGLLLPHSHNHRRESFLYRWDCKISSERLWKRKCWCQYLEQSPARHTKCAPLFAFLFSRPRTFPSACDKTPKLPKVPKTQKRDPAFSQNFPYPTKVWPNLVPSCRGEATDHDGLGTTGTVSSNSVSRNSSIASEAGWALSHHLVHMYHWSSQSANGKQTKCESIFKE